MKRNSHYTEGDVRRLVNSLGQTSREIAAKCHVSDREIRHYRAGSRSCPPNTFRLLQLSAWIHKAYPYLKAGEVVPDKIFWELEAMWDEGNEQD